jgi:hypothetical protein
MKTDIPRDRTSSNPNLPQGVWVFILGDVMEKEELPAELTSIRPGTIWCWGPLREYTKCVIKVMEVEKRKDGNWWVLSKVIKGYENEKKGVEAWNEVSRFIEAAVLVSIPD